VLILWEVSFFEPPVYSDELVKKMWYMYPTKYYSSIKKSEIMLFAGRWMELENIMLTKVSQDQNSQRSHISPHVWKLDL
jgi:hypothetical protein